MTRRVEDSLEQLPGRFRGDPAGRVRGRYRLVVGKVERHLEITPCECRVRRAPAPADAEIFVTPEAWMEIDEGRLSGIEAFAQRRLWVRGSIEKTLLFEPLFDRPDAGALKYTVETVETGRASVSCLAAGPVDAPPLLLIHGLGGTKASWMTVIPALAQRYRVLALDLPGFGASSKPWGGYDAGWFSSHVFSFMDEVDIDRAFLAGNSMGGRVAMEMAMLQPERIAGIACLCPATAFSRRPWLSLARIARAEWGMAVVRLPRSLLCDELRSLFARPGRIRDEWYEAAIDDFLHVWKSPRARLAFFAAAQRIYLDEPSGENGFWARLSKMDVPAMYVFGDHDVLISHRFARQVADAVPAAKVAVWKDCGHVPQLEHPARTARSMLSFFDRHQKVIDLEASPAPAVL